MYSPDIFEQDLKTSAGKKLMFAEPGSIFSVVPNLIFILTKFTKKTSTLRRIGEKFYGSKENKLYF